MVLKECMLLNNRCYKKGEKIIGNPVGIVVHSTGANNNTLKRYVQPIVGQSNYNEIIDDIGVNKYHNDWNRENMKDACVHAFIGLNSKGKVETYQTLPFGICCWGVGDGKKGSFNYNPTAKIQFEICEDNLKDEKYFSDVMQEAQDFCAYLCKKFSLPVSSITSHHESFLLGYGCGHADCDHWLKNFNKTMDWFRNKVAIRLNETEKILYKVQVGAFSNKQNAERYALKFQLRGYSTYIEKVVGAKTLYKVQTGAFSNIENAFKMANEIRSIGYSAIVKEVKYNGGS